MKPIEAYWKLDHTICMNSNEGNIKWNIDNKDDKTLYGENQEGYDPIDTDCKSIDEAIDCLETIEKSLKALEIIKEKAVNVFDILATSNADYYNMCVTKRISPQYYSSYFLTQEEYEILKEVLK